MLGYLPLSYRATGHTAPLAHLAIFTPPPLLPVSMTFPKGSSPRGARMTEHHRLLISNRKIEVGIRKWLGPISEVPPLFIVVFESKPSHHFD